MYELLHPLGIGYRAEKGSLRLCYTLATADAARAARILRADPLTRAHVHPLLEHAAASEFFNADTELIGHLCDATDLGVLLRSAEGVDGVLTSARICWRPRDESRRYSIEVLPSEATRARALLRAAPDLCHLLADGRVRSGG
jgi:hypothetical protein